MSEVVEIGLPTRPPWARNWWERFQLRLHITPKHMKEVLNLEELVIKRTQATLDLLRVSSPNCDLIVLWPEKEVKAICMGDCICKIKFDVLTSPAMNLRDITDYVLSCIKR